MVMKAIQWIFKGIVTSSILLLSSCASYDGIEAYFQKENSKAVSAYRTVRLTGFGIEVNIPVNYRAIRPHQGIVQMFDPEMSYYVETIRSFYPERSMSLREQAIWSVGYAIDEQGNRVPNAKEILDYKQGDVSGYIVKYDNGTGYSVMFVGKIVGSEKILEIGTVCDCDLEITAITDLLSRIRLTPA